MNDWQVRYVKWETVSKRTGERRLSPSIVTGGDGAILHLQEASAVAMARHYARETKAGAEVVHRDGTRLPGGEYLWDPERNEVVRVREVRLLE